MGATGLTSSLDARGPAAAEIAFLWWLMFGIAAVVFVIVLGALAYALMRARREGQRPEDPAKASRQGNRAVLWLGAIIPALILTVVFGFNVRSLVVLAGPPSRDEALTIQAVGHQFWWEIRYLRPGQSDGEAVVSANEVWLPVGQRVRLEVTGDDVIHSFWIPSLHGKIDTIPGETNVFWLEADREATLRGLCAEFCGLQHANMAFIVRAVPPQDFDTWLAGQARPAPIPATAAAQRGQQIFLGSACVYCHAIRGTNASGRIGPDLTHFASRETIGAGLLENNRGNLAGWTVNAQALKPGNRMPPMYLDGDSLQDLLTYMETLR